MTQVKDPDKIALKNVLKVIEEQVSNLDEDSVNALNSLNHIIESLGNVSKSINLQDDEKYVNNMIFSASIIIKTLEVYLIENDISLEYEGEDSE